MKKKLVILSAAAMAVAAAVPALAFENEFHGMYRLRANVTNFQEAGLAGFKCGASSSCTTPASSITRNTNSIIFERRSDFTIFEQRARIQYIAKASDDLQPGNLL